MRSLLTGLSAMSLVVLLSSSVFAAPPLKAPSCLAVVDSTGAAVGTIVSVSTNPYLGDRSAIIAISYQGKPYLLQIDAYGILSGGSGTNAVVWTTPDCTGTPYAVTNGVGGLSLFPENSVAPPNLTLYAQVPGAVTQTIQAQSIWIVGDQTCTPYPVEINAIQATAVVDLSTLMQPPFTTAINGCQ